MRYAILTLLLVSTISGCGLFHPSSKPQINSEWQQAGQNFYVYYTAGDQVRALSEAEREAYIAERDYGRDSIEYAAATNDRAMIY